MFTMFERFKEIQKKARRLKMNQLIKATLSDKDEQAEIVRMNTMDQLYEEGIDSMGRPLGNYSLATIHGTKNFEGKIAKGQRYDHITLNDTGKFYDSFRVKLFNDALVIVANTSKPDSDLAQDFGKDILGLTKENLGYVIEDAKKNIPSQVREKLFT